MSCATVYAQPDHPGLPGYYKTVCRQDKRENKTNPRYERPDFQARLRARGEGRSTGRKRKQRVLKTRSRAPKLERPYLPDRAPPPSFVRGGGSIHNQADGQAAKRRALFWKGYLTNAKGRSKAKWPRKPIPRGRHIHVREQKEGRFGKRFESHVARTVQGPQG